MLHCKRYCFIDIEDDIISCITCQCMHAYMGRVLDAYNTVFGVKVEKKLLGLNFYSTSSTANRHHIQPHLQSGPLDLRINILPFVLSTWKNFYLKRISTTVVTEVRTQDMWHSSLCNTVESLVYIKFLCLWGHVSAWFKQ